MIIPISPDPCHLKAGNLYDDSRKVRKQVPVFVKEEDHQQDRIPCDGFLQAGIRSAAPGQQQELLPAVPL